MLWLSILSTIICIICQSSVSSKLISLSSNLARNTMILLSVIILMLMRWILRSMLTLALRLSSLLVCLKFLLLYLIIVNISSFVLFHTSQTRCTSRHWFSETIILKNCGCCGGTNTLLTSWLLVPILFDLQLLPTDGIRSVVWVIYIHHIKFYNSNLFINTT